jgi:hypothetical protein
MSEPTTVLAFPIAPHGILYNNAVLLYRSDTGVWRIIRSSIKVSKNPYEDILFIINKAYRISHDAMLRPDYDETLFTELLPIGYTAHITTNLTEDEEDYDVYAIYAIKFKYDYFASDYSVDDILEKARSYYRKMSKELPSHYIARFSYKIKPLRNLSGRIIKYLGTGYVILGDPVTYDEALSIAKKHEPLILEITK